MTMDIPYRQYSYLFLDHQFIAELSTAKDLEEKKRTFIDYISLIDSPYELYRLIFSGEVSEYIDNAASIMLDFLIETKTRWDDDELICFLLEVATDHTLLYENSSWLITVNYQNMLELEYAGLFIWDLFGEACSEGVYFHLLKPIINHYKWNKIFAKALEESTEDEADKNLYHIAAQMLEYGVLDVLPPESSSAKTFVEAMELVEKENFDEAIPLLLEFNYHFPQIFPLKVTNSLAISYLKIGWRGLSLEWILESLKQYPENKEAQDIHDKILANDKGLIEKVKQDLSKSYLWTSEALEVLALAEFLYRYHGRMLKDYSPIISGYTRAIEIELKKRLLPKLRKWIELYGKVNTKNGRFYIREGTKNLYADVEEYDITLGTWCTLFNQENPQQYADTPGEFYYCIRIVYGVGVSQNKLVEFGKKLDEIRKLRNPASHSSIDDWNMVNIGRNITFNIWGLLKTTTGDILR